MHDMSTTPLAKSSRIRRALLLATGQTTSYGSGAGVDDGALQKGVVKSYTILTADQYSGTTNITINSKTDVHSNNCVIDNNTGLMWNRYASATVGASGALAWTTNVNGEGIFAYCAAANVAGLSGYSDWRVPNIYEAFSLCDYEAPTSLPNSTAFPSMVSAIWSATTAPNAITSAVYVVYSPAGIIGVSTKTTTVFVLLVRG